MAPSAVESVSLPTSKNFTHGRKPLKYSGSLDGFESEDITPVIGTEYPTAKLVDWINAPNADDLLRDLAIKSEYHDCKRHGLRDSALTITVSERGVVFFRAQNDLTNDLQKQLIQRLGELTGKPSTSGLHIHPILNSERELGGDDPQISTISSIQNRKFYSVNPSNTNGTKKKQSSAQWHSDIAFEPVPADYTALRLTQLPRTGGGKIGSQGV